MMSDEWRVNVVGYPVTVRGEVAREYLEGVNRAFGRLRMENAKLRRRVAELEAGAKELMGAINRTWPEAVASIDFDREWCALEAMLLLPPPPEAAP